MQEIKDTQIEMKKASENRESENKEFQETVAYQRATQEILKKAVERLGEFYNKKAALAQTGQVPGAAAPPPPPGFGEYKKPAVAAPWRSLRTSSRSPPPWR